MRFFLEGEEITAGQAWESFDENSLVQGISGDESRAMWNQCLVSEEARDMWFPGGLEMVQE